MSKRIGSSSVDLMSRVVGYKTSDLGIGDFEESRTVQSEASEADINVIIRRYEKVGMIPVDQREPLFIDVSDIGSYRDVIEHVRAADAAFMSQPAELRARFGNDVAAWLDFCSDPNNREEMISLGLLPKEAEAAPVADAAPPVPAKPGPEGSGK